MSPILTQELKCLLYNVAIHNSEESYKKLFGLLFNPLYRFSFGMLKSKEQAEEVASDVMFRLWQNRVEMLQVDNIKVYALVIARNMSLNMLKSNSRNRSIPLEETHTETGKHVLSPEQILINAEDRAKLEYSIQSLPTRCKLVFKLIKEEGLSYKEVGTVLSISSKTVDAHLVTAMKKLTEAVRSNLTI
ncbi:MAG TPA: sigma-70 family RNA polymerase sigma factor [Chitinophagaceae bacterium]|nr:sigma-70 family RNA polymerase sigma factor [Chitinophagaceae bacterium]